jgi:uncharacterized membrane protein
MHSFGSDIFGFIFGLILFGLLVFLLIYYIAYHNREPSPHQRIDPLEIAKARYAKGEINKTEFEEIKKVLND